jgi:hypothetical protein
MHARKADLADVPLFAAQALFAPTSVAFEPWTTKRSLPVDVHDCAYSCAAVGTYYYQYAGWPSTASGGAMVKYATATDVWATGTL